jgi:CheY-like chemotaxis protein/HPt (histidine-containing phosphotransfer) domain-containing protein
VEDSGIGIDPRILPRLFTTFEQADVSTTRKYGGTGLGLAITRRLAEAMGGQAGAESRHGVGSTFWFTARLKKGTGADEAEAQPSPAAFAPRFESPAHRRILLVEDNEINLEVAVELLNAVGMVVATARDGLEALEKAKAEEFDLVLMDVQMPVMDGLTATREIRKLAGWATRPIVALSANVFDEDRRACLEAGMNDFVTKPVDPVQLYATLARWLAGANVASAPLVSKTAPNRVRPFDPPISGLDAPQGLRRMNGNLAGYRKLVRRFAEIHRGDIARIHERLRQDDTQDAGLIAHTLKGAAGNIGAKSVMACAACVEAAIKDGADVIAVEQSAAATAIELDRLVAAILARAEPDLAVEADAILDNEEAPRMLDELEAALEAGDVRANELVEASAGPLRSALGSQFDALQRQVAEYLYPEALETLKRARSGGLAPRDAAGQGL